MLRQARVVNVNPKAHTADIVMTDNGGRYPNVQVMSSAWVSTNTGSLGLPTPTPGQSDYDLTAPTDSDRAVYAYVGFVGTAPGMPVIVGFKVPEIGQMTFDRPGFQVARHESDVYSTVNAAGDIEQYHPSGSYFRLATDADHEDLTGQDYDGKWAIVNNTDAAPTLYYEHRNAGTKMASVEIDSDGNVTTGTAGNWSTTIQGTATVSVTGDVTSSANSWTHTGDVTIDGNLIVTGTVTGQTDVIADTISGLTHLHGGVTTGGGDTGAPI